MAPIGGNEMQAGPINAFAILGKPGGVVRGCEEHNTNWCK